MGAFGDRLLEAFEMVKIEDGDSDIAERMGLADELRRDIADESALTADDREDLAEVARPVRGPDLQYNI